MLETIARMILFIANVFGRTMPVLTLPLDEARGIEPRMRRDADKCRWSRDARVCTRGAVERFPCSFVASGKEKIDASTERYTQL